MEEVAEKVVEKEVTKIVSEERMLGFYRQLNILKLKYDLEEPDPESSIYFQNQNAFKNDYDAYVKAYAELERREEAFRLSELTKIEYGDILPNLDIIYAEMNKSDRIIELFDLIRGKIISGYICIDGLERLFSEKYIDFEWDMHLGIDFKTHKMKFYRDHFVHQIRNAYCMHVLLEQCGWCSLIEKVLNCEEKSKISRYVGKCVMQQKQIMPQDKLECDHFYYKNIIYMACYMSALFHDIGYPEVTNAANQNRIIDYISNLYNTESSGYNYSRLRALLQNSLLFRVVPLEEIQNRISGAKIDHGALSAIIFLLNFYENGVIQGLVPYKRCAVELAALAIYNHTNKYTYENSVKEGEYIRNLFSLNPIAYILRICDDLQEWGRIYFELSDKSNMIICNTCKTPAIRRKKSDGSFCYDCNCCHVEKDKEALFYPMFDYSTNFPYRRIYNVTVCEILRIEESERGICFHLDYKLDRLLHIAYISPDYARYRIKELNKLKRHFEYQPELPKMRLRYFMTPNPILIKVEILDRYLSDVVDQASYEELREEVYRYAKGIALTEGTEREQKKNLFANGVERIEELCMKEINSLICSVYNQDSHYSLIVDNVRDTVKIYILLVIFMWLFKRNNQEDLREGELLCQMGREYIRAQRKVLDIAFSEDVSGLLEDCLLQFSRMYMDTMFFEVTPKAYFEQFVTDEYTYGCIGRFLSSEMYEPICYDNKKRIDGYTDLALCQAMLKEEMLIV